MADAQFPVVRRGYEPKAVDTALAGLEARLAEAEATVQAARSYSAGILTDLQRLRAIEDELTTSLELARRTAEAVERDAQDRARQLLATAEQEAGGRLAVAELEGNTLLRDATAEAEAVRAAAAAESGRLLAEGRARLAAEAAEMEQYRLAIAAEASMLEQIEHRLGPRLSRAAARLIEVVDGADGIGPFSEAAGCLVDAARLLQRAVHDGVLESVAVETEGGQATLRISTGAIDLRDGPPVVPIGTGPVISGAGPTAPAQPENAANISSMALS